MEVNETLEDDLAIAEDRIIELIDENKKLKTEISSLKTKLAQFDMQSSKVTGGTIRLNNSGMYELRTSYNITPNNFAWLDVDSPAERNNGGTTGTSE